MRSDLGFYLIDLRLIALAMVVVLAAACEIAYRAGSRKQVASDSFRSLMNGIGAATLGLLGLLLGFTLSMAIARWDARRDVIVNESNAIGTLWLGDQSQPRVAIGSRRDGNETICYVRDNGIGIDPRYHEKVFGLFDQLNPKVEGSGIGLSLVKRIVEVHGGRIWVESEGAGHGTTFCFTLAARSESQESERTEPKTASR